MERISGSNELRYEYACMKNRPIAVHPASGIGLLRIVSRVLVSAPYPILVAHSLPHEGLW